MDEVALAELAESIRRVGVIEPLVIERTGDRFRVIAGHRRLIACGIVHFSPVPCLVRNAGEVDPAAVAVAENYYREDVNPAEEAIFLDRLLKDRCNGDVDLLATLIRHRREYIDDRLLLLRGSEEVLHELAARRIPLAVARELNKVKDPGQRVMYLDAAIRGGATASVVRTWRSGSELTEQPAPANGIPSDPAAASATVAPAPVMECLFCGDADDPHLIEVVYLHRQCRKFLGRILDRSHEPAAEGKG